MELWPNVERQRERLRLVMPQSSITWHIAISMVGTEPCEDAAHAIWLKKAAASGEPGAQYDLSQLYKYGAYSVP